MYILPWLVSLVAVTTAAPSNIWDDAYDFSEDLSEYFTKVSENIKSSKSRSPNSYGSCDTSKISLPSYASGLTSPDGLTATYVALGRGTQNYTCADSTSNSTPAAIGAVASLFDATCIAANWPGMLEMMPNVAYKISLPSNALGKFPLANLDLIGHHFFYDSTTPEFNLDTISSKQYGIAMTSKQASIDAPTNATKGKYGAVSWLYLTTKSGTVGDYKAVYRVNTASGAAPSTCKGMPSSFEIQYAALYYFYS